MVPSWTYFYIDCDQLSPKAGISVSRQDINSSRDFIWMTPESQREPLVAMLFLTGRGLHFFQSVLHLLLFRQEVKMALLFHGVHTTVLHVINSHVRFHENVGHRLTFPVTFPALSTYLESPCCLFKSLDDLALASRASGSSISGYYQRVGSIANELRTCLRSWDVE